MANDVTISVGMKNAASPELQKLIGDASKTRSEFTQLFGAFTAGNLAASAILKLKDAVVRFFTDGFNAVENMKMSTASLASTITTFAKGSSKDLAGTYRQAYEYSTLLVEKVEEWDAKTVATGKDLMAMVETFAQGGVLLDVNNKKQEEGFIAIANALALMTQGQNKDIQMRQEVRGLIDGEAKATNRLAVLIEQSIGGNLKKNIQQWKEQGTLIENAGNLLKGFSAGAADIENTWAAVGSTLQTIYNQVLRGMFEPIYKDIIEWGKQIVRNVYDQQKGSGDLADTLRNGLHKTWLSIKNTMESILNLLSGFKEPLIWIAKILGTAAEGWGMILAVLPEIAKRIGLITQGVWDVVAAGGRLGETFYRLSILDLQGAAKAWEQAKSNWQAAGQHTAQAFSSGFGDELYKKLQEYNKNIASPKTEKIGKPPAMKSPPGEEDAAAKKLAEEVRKANEAAAEGTKKAWEESAKHQHEFDIWLTEQSGGELDRRYAKAEDTWRKQRDLLVQGTDDYNVFVQKESALEQWLADEKGKIFHEEQMKMVAQAKEELDIKTQFLPEQLAAYQEIYADLREYGMDDLNFSQQIISDKRDLFIKAGVDINKADLWWQKENEKNLIAWGKTSHSAIAGVQSAFLEMYHKAMTAGRAWYEMTVTLFSSAQSTLSTVFFDAVKGELKSFSDYWESFTDALLRKFVDIVAQMTIEWAAGQLFMGQSMQTMPGVIGNMAMGGRGGLAAVGGLAGLGGLASVFLPSSETLGGMASALPFLGESEVFGGLFHSLQMFEAGGGLGGLLGGIGSSLLGPLGVLGGGLLFGNQIVDTVESIVEGVGGFLGDAVDSIGDFFGDIFHDGGMIGGWQYAHAGLTIGPKLKSDERAIIGQTGERVLNRAETAAYGKGQAINISLILDGKVLAKHIYNATKSGEKMVHERGITAR